MFVVNTLLGGYFGSRLMSNVREKKGYTYNIYSAIETMRFDGYFYVSTETGNDVAEDAVKQIFTEIEILQNNLVGKKELELARNYLMGTLLSQMDGPFNTMDLVRSLAADGLTLSFFQDAIRVVQEITPEEIRELAQRYLGRDEMWEVFVGP
jgi:predicted Zn-dependent peptidase